MIFAIVYNFPFLAFQKKSCLSLSQEDHGFQYFKVSIIFMVVKDFLS